MEKNQDDVFGKSKALVCAIIDKMGNINKSRKKFLTHIFILYLGLRGRYNFLGMERYGQNSEQTYRNNFEKQFDFLTFNTELIRRSCSKNLITVFDPSYIPKSGKKTEHIGTFWSGCAQKAKRGLEIGGFAVVDLENNTAFSLEAVQTPTAQELNPKGKTLVSHYASLTIERKDILLSFSKYQVVDGYFAKREYIIPVTTETDLEIISKLRNDANLSYVYKGQPTGRQGRPKVLDGKIKMTQVDKRKIRYCYQDDESVVYEGIVYNKTLKRKIKIAYVEKLKRVQSKEKYAVLFSTDLELSGQQIYLYYKSRFQIEFLYRDAKQFTGLTHCQAQGANKLYFHFNMSLSAVSLAKVIHYLKIPKEKRGAFSMSDIKTMYLNKIVADRIISNLKIDLTCKKNRRAYLNSLWFGKIAS
ncbi:MAG: transposase [Bacteroidia bacterium]|nr:transposase [Bacteroidia bacterium]